MNETNQHLLLNAKQLSHALGDPLLHHRPVDLFEVHLEVELLGELGDAAQGADREDSRQRGSTHAAETAPCAGSVISVSGRSAAVEEGVRMQCLGHAALAATMWSQATSSSCFLLQLDAAEGLIQASAQHIAHWQVFTHLDLLHELLGFAE